MLLNVVDLDAMTPSERLDEVCSLLAGGMLRLRRDLGQKRPFLRPPPLELCRESRLSVSDANDKESWQWN